MEKQTTLIQRLTILMYLAIAGLICSFVVYVPFIKSFADGLELLCNIGSIICVFLLMFAGKRYRKAAIFGSVQLVCTIGLSMIPWILAFVISQDLLSTDNVNQFYTVAGVINLICGLVGIVYVYQLYHAHAEQVQELDGKLSKKWKRLFWWSILASVFSSFFSYIFAAFYVGMGGNMPPIYNLFSFMTYLPGKIIAVVGILYLNRTVKTLKTSVEVI